MARHSEFRAGGPVIVVSFLGLLFSVGTLSVYPFGLFFAPIHAELGWSRAEIAGALALSQMCLALAGPLHGFLIDRVGARPMIFASIICLGVAIGSLNWLTASLWHFYAIFLAVTFLGASASPIGYARVLIGHFDRHRGLALGLALAGVGLGAAVLPPLVQTMIDLFDWRVAYLGLGVLALLPLPFAMWLLKEAPAVVVKASPIVASTANSATFVFLAVIFLGVGAVSIGVFAHLVPYLTDAGFTPAKAASYAAMVGMAVIVGRACVGWVMDYVRAPLVMSLIAVGLAAACLLLRLQSGEPFLIVASILLGLGLGAEVDLLSYLVSRYWPPTAFGRVYGALFGLFAVGTGVGPLLMGAAFDRFGDYQYALIAAGGASLVIAALCFVLPGYRRPNAAPNVEERAVQGA